MSDKDSLINNPLVAPVGGVNTGPEANTDTAGNDLIKNPLVAPEGTVNTGPEANTDTAGNDVSQGGK